MTRAERRVLELLRSRGSNVAVSEFLMLHIPGAVVQELIGMDLVAYDDATEDVELTDLGRQALWDDEARRGLVSDR